MPHYYFHLRNGSQLTIDTEGEDFPDDDAARAEAVESVHEMLAEAIRKKNENPSPPAAHRAVSACIRATCPVLNSEGIGTDRTTRPWPARKFTAVAYLRTSSQTNASKGLTADKDSDKRQRAAVAGFAKANGYEIVDEFYDVVSGATRSTSAPASRRCSTASQAMACARSW